MMSLRGSRSSRSLGEDEPVSSEGNIVSLVPAATEIICALGLRERLVGISHECDHPADVKTLPVVTEARIDSSKNGQVIDREVRALVEQGQSLYRVHVEVLRSLKPSLIVTQDQCEVCALGRDDLEVACKDAGLSSVRIISLRAIGLYDVPRDFRRIAEAAGFLERGDVAARAFTQRLAAVKARVQGCAPPRVLLVEWLSPPMIAGGWMPDLARVAGGQPLVVSDNGHFTTVSWDEIAREDPDVVVLLPCGFPAERTLAELDTLEIGPRLRDLRSTREGRTFVVDGNAYFNRPGPRLADSAEILASLFHPERAQVTEKIVVFR